MDLCRKDMTSLKNLAHLYNQPFWSFDGPLLAFFGEGDDSDWEELFKLQMISTFKGEEIFFSFYFLNKTAVCFQTWKSWENLKGIQNFDDTIFKQNNIPGMFSG